MSTIFALASAPGKAGVSVIRISGPEASKALKVLGVAPLPSPRVAVLKKIYSPVDDGLIDNALILWMPAPNSFTGEDVAEIHVHGSRAVIAYLTEALSTTDNLRLAEPGEFARRAFINGKMDLTEVEGLGDLIEAETKLQQKQALRQMSGELSALYEEWRKQLIKSLSHMEAYIDFPDEDLPKEVEEELIEFVKKLKKSIDKHLDDNGRGEILRRGVYAVILGAPNVGKSSLMNYLAKRDVAIVSNIAGTTRDVIEVNMDIAGFPVTIADTAGIRKSKNEIENEGIKRAREKAKQADMKIIIFDAETYPRFDKKTAELIDDDSILIANKSDIKKLPAKLEIEGRKVIPISVTKETGIKEFMKILEKELKERMMVGSEPNLTRAHHRKSLQECSRSLERFLNGRKKSVDIEISAEDLRLSARELGRITGRIDVEDILDELFRSFCIGK